LPLAALEYDPNMRRLFHTALGVWFLIAMTMAQGCAAPAQSGGYSARNANSSANANAGNSNDSQWATAMRPQENAHVGAQGYVADPGASTALTDYLKKHRLPLVGAQVLRNPSDGSRIVVLYGFVGSDFGKSDAQRKAEDYINDASVDVDNRIRVNPELLSAGSSSSTGSADSSGNADPDAQDSQTPADASAAASMPGVQSYVDQQNQEAQIQQYQQQNSMSGMSSMLPLIALLGILSMEMAATSSGGFAGGPAMGGYPRYGYSSPFGASPYGSPYGTSPYGSPYSSPFGYSAPVAPPYTSSPSYGTVGPGYGSRGGYGYGSSSGSVTPYGSLPGSPYYPSP
jgi:hypothetical protein